jgi:predicted nucleic acid-binding protein
MSGFLLDTNVVSELILPKPNAHVVGWMSAQQANTLFLSTMTIGELMRGASRLGDTQRGIRLRRWIYQGIATQFENRILDFDQRSALRWGDMMGTGDRKGSSLPSADAQIASVAIVNRLTVVTRNVKDFERMLDSVVNPFEPL